MYVKDKIGDHPLFDVSEIPYKPQMNYTETLNPFEQYKRNTTEHQKFPRETPPINTQNSQKLKFPTFLEEIQKDEKFEILFHQLKNEQNLRQTDLQEYTLLQYQSIFEEILCKKYKLNFTTVNIVDEDKKNFAEIYMDIVEAGSNCISEEEKKPNLRMKNIQEKNSDKIFEIILEEAKSYLFYVYNIEIEHNEYDSDIARCTIRKKSGNGHILEARAVYISKQNKNNFYSKKDSPGFLALWLLKKINRHSYHAIIQSYIAAQLSLLLDPACIPAPQPLPYNKISPFQHSSRATENGNGNENNEIISYGSSSKSLGFKKVSLDKIKEQLDEIHQKIISIVDSIEYSPNFGQFKFPSIKNLKNPEEFFFNVDACLKDKDYSSILNMVIQKQFGKSLDLRVEKNKKADFYIENENLVRICGEFLNKKTAKRVSSLIILRLISKRVFTSILDRELDLLSSSRGTSDN